MNISGLALVSIFILAIFFSGCTSPSPAPSLVSSPAEADFDHLLLSTEDLPQGLILAAGGPMQASDITGSMKRFGARGGYRALYTDAIPLTDKSKVMEQDIIIVNGPNASAMLDEHRKSFTATTSKISTALQMTDPGIGEKSFAVKITTTSPSGADTTYYAVGFVRSGIFEVLSAEGTPATYPAFLQIAERAAEKIS